MYLVNYIEKDISRRIVLLNYIYSHSHSETKKLCQTLDVSTPTLKNDFNILCDLLSDYIAESSMTTQHINISFTKNTTLSQVSNILYRESKFIRVLYHKLIDPEITNNEIKDLEFISEGLTYKLSKRANDFIQENFTTENEVKYRMLLNDIIVKVNLTESDQEKNKTLIQEANTILGKIFDKRTMYINEFEKDIILTNIFLALQRADTHPLNMKAIDFEFITKNELFNKIFKLYTNHLDEEVAYTEAILTTIICYQFINYKDFLVVQTIHNQLWNAMTQQYISVYQLYIQLLSMNNKPIIDEVTLQRKLIHLLFNSWLELDLFTPHLMIDTNDYQFITFYRTLQRWVEYFNLPITLQENGVIELFHFYKNMLLTYDNYYTCNIVVNNQDQFTYIFNFLYKYLSSSQFKINSTIYYSLEEIPDELLQYPYVILCDHALYEENYKHAQNIFPFSVDNLRSDVKDLINQLFDNTLKNKG